MTSHYPNLNADKALIWRITHRQNIPWILANGLYAGNSAPHFDDWVTIGNEDLIGRRAHRHVPLPPGGVLNDYVPFYFTPFSPMMYNIYTGRGGVRSVTNSDIVILVSDLHKVSSMGLPFVFTDRHAYPVTARYFNNLASLPEIDWPLLQDRNFRRNPDDPEQIERYQAEALIHHHLPIQALLGAVCYTPQVQLDLQAQAKAAGVSLQVHCLPNWYF
ncbi:DUF4433 domain-containing protein [Zhongshania sp.]|jgi:hypothetical protein|uniref:type II toxin-antitoxin system toxin DNA ADP-ribosyl transferase DarT n=1 Tax=Zhongshania sp. TaxID=1971902 RepID=UPI002A7F8660|nr:DUF4433 domain-containing protein [Zhongshania sp.]